MTSKPAASEAGPIGRSPDWQRARRPEQKAERRQAILAAAVSLLDENGVEGATLSEIARRAKLSKANCYRYFESREAILLAITIDEANAWTAGVIQQLESLAGSNDLEAVADVFARTTTQHPRLCMLFSSLSSVLERNVSVEAVAEFKREFNASIFGSVDRIRSAISELSTEQAERFLVFLGLIIAGAWPNANPSPAVAEVLAREEFASRKLDFETTLRMHSRVVLLGFLAEPSA